MAKQPLSPAAKVASLPVYAVVALLGLLSEFFLRVVAALSTGAKTGGRAVATAAAVPAVAAAGMIWEVKDLLHHSHSERTAVSTLLAQPSIVNWHEPAK